MHAKRFSVDGPYSGRRSGLFWALMAVATAQTACSGQESAPGTGTNGSVEWSPLIHGDWALPPGVEAYFCVRQTVTEEIRVGAYRPVSPPGTHHTVLSVDDPVEPDGFSECSGSTQGKVVVFGSGVGTQALSFPEGIATTIPEGKQLLLNLHVFNTRDTPLSGRSSVEVVRVDRSRIVYEAEAVFAGETGSLQVRPGKSTQVGTCTLKGDVTIFAAAPHMHQLGSHMTATTSASEAPGTTVLDRDYSFDDQSYTLLDGPITLRQGDRLEVECTYENPGASTVGFGMSSRDEMCFLGTYWYPALGAGPFCFDD
jgi:hypothetical protein